MSHLRLFIVVILLLLINTTQALATPLDYNNDSLSDPAAVVPNNNLRWTAIINNRERTILSAFGELGQHLVPGNYLGGLTIPATVSSSGVWNFGNSVSLKFGDQDSLFIAGGDFDGDSKTDIAVSTNVCQDKSSTFSALLNPLNPNPTIQELKANKGLFYKVYYDANHDNRDDFCTLTPLKSGATLLNKFKILCKDVITKQRTGSFVIGQVNNQPLVLKLVNQPDFIITYNQTSARTRLKFIDRTGRVVRNVTIPQNGEVLIGNFTSAISEQVAVVKDQAAIVYNLLTHTTSTLTFPDGVPYDQINLVNFKNNPDCFCTSREIAKNKTCSGSVSKPQEPEKDQLYVPNNCSNPPEHLTFNDGFKCIPSATRGGSIVCILPYQFTWKPFRMFTDHHGVTMACNKHDTHFDKVELVLKSGERIALAWDKCQNYVATTEGPIGRQHFRNEQVQWSSIQNKVATIEMFKGDLKTCLKF